ncbi:MAG: B12-binding domain-containing radical SAM protein [Planctomycetes bacterium]|jgi:anaerobic magnesium-protoporphyrin IX monomethyl ester cyclase|nr:B12-binding domain-containing radical SAM protein [Planctomycetota bacterium]
MSSDNGGKRFQKAFFIVVPSRIDNYNNTYYPPLGVLYIVSTLEANGFDADVLDASLDTLSDDRIIDEIRRRDPDVIGLSCTTHTRFEMRDVAAAIKDAFPDKFIVVGGPHVSFCPEETLENTAVDAVIIGEGEMKTLDLFSGKPQAEIPGLAYRDNGRIVVNPNRGFIRNLDSLPSPARHKIDLNRYPGYSTLRHRTTHVLSNRGCPFGCLYCSATFFWGKITRSLSAEKVLSEIENLVTNYGIKAIYFYDDAFTADKRKARRVCEALIEKNLGLVWGTSTRIDLVNEELLALMARAGCRQIDYGLETLNLDVQRKVGTKATYERARDTIRMTIDAGIGHVKVYLIIGLPGDTPEQLRETFAKTLSTVATEVSSQILRIYPGTPIEKLARERGIIPEGFSWYDDFREGWSMFECVPQYTEWPAGMLERQYAFLTKYMRISSALRQRIPKCALPAFAKADVVVFRAVTGMMKCFRSSALPSTEATDAEAECVASYQ